MSLCKQIMHIIKYYYTPTSHALNFISCHNPFMIIAVRKAFVRCTCSQNWEDAVSRFPMFTSEDRLSKFTALNFKQGIPDQFRAYCQSALNLQIPSQESVKVTDEGIRVAAVCGPLTSLSAEKLKEADPAYPGAQLILVNTPKVFYYYYNTDT